MVAGTSTIANIKIYSKPLIHMLQCKRFISNQKGPALIMTKKYLAFDVGGTSIKYAVVDSQLQILHSGKRPSERNHNQAIIKALQGITDELTNQFVISGIGVSTAGRVGSDGEIVYAGPTINNYQGTPIRHILHEETHLPVHVMNDVDAALLGEVLHGHYDPDSTVYCITLGTGIGGAFYLNGHLVDGAHNLANSVGYLNYNPQTHTSFESQSSTLALQHQLSPLGVSVPEAFEKARHGNPQFESIIHEWSNQLGHQIAQICILLDPDIFLVGGAVSQQGDFFINQLQSATNRYLPEGFQQVKIMAPQFKERAQIFGAISPFF